MNADFGEFFAALWRSERWPSPEPFPWQRMLAERAAKGDWPEAIDLPTASGKTACLEAAVYGLAATAEVAREKRMPRRIWFVVDRRIVVDEAYERAAKVAAALARAKDGPLWEIAESLRGLGGERDRPLAVGRLRGGIWRDDGWARLPCQPAILCSTVDQVGSALLFRAYGHGGLSAPIYAGLAGNDSLILLDEAHCAVPFQQTLRGVAELRGPRWSSEGPRSPFRWCVMSATPRMVGGGGVFPAAGERARALDSPVLRRRLEAEKPARLAAPVAEDEFVAAAAREAAGYAQSDRPRRVAVMVNRVRTAVETAERLRAAHGKDFNVLLLTGRMRPLDRDELIEGWSEKLRAGTEAELERSVVVVSTQCLEVGADFSFDDLVTECASLDALRQRFGRLNRMGERRETGAVVLVRREDLEPDAEDWIYGGAIREAWRWLKDLAVAGCVDFGVAAMERAITAARASGEDRLALLLAPATDAPVLLPAHMDLLCQTSPRPKPEPDVAMFLHGKDRGAAEARVVFRCDLCKPEVEGAEERWIEAVSLAPPSGLEALSVPLFRLREWLEGRRGYAQGGDVEGRKEAEEDTEAEAPTEARERRAAEPFLIWRGRQREADGRRPGRKKVWRSEMTADPGRISPGSTIVLRAEVEALRELGQPAGGSEELRPDLAEAAAQKAGRRIFLRLHPRVLEAWSGNAGIKALLEAARDGEEAGRAEMLEAMDLALAAAGEGAALPLWLREALRELRRDGFRRLAHPDQGMVLAGRKRPQQPREEDVDAAAEDDDLESLAAVAGELDEHTRRVAREAERFARLCLPAEIVDTVVAAARWHDAGKLDGRFQMLLRGGDEAAAMAGPALAKSGDLPLSARARRAVWLASGLPAGFRHEMLSASLAEWAGAVPAAEAEADLLLHLIRSHHGHGRPFAPVVVEARPPEIAGELLGCALQVAAAERSAWTPAHQTGAGVADGFWRCARRHGWWGLAMAEAVLRLADWRASAADAGEAGNDKTWRLARGEKRAGREWFTLELRAMDGANPLGFLAAMGVLRVLSGQQPGLGAGLGWKAWGGGYTPVVRTAAAVAAEELAAVLAGGGDFEHWFPAELLAASEAAGPANKKGVPSWRDKLKFPVAAYRDYCLAAQAGKRVKPEYAAVWAAETSTTGEEGREVARKTRFDFTAGQQAFVAMAREIVETARAADFEATLFAGWRYGGNPSMRWDPQDEKRQYALQAFDPTDARANPPRSDLGANFLALQALPLFPMIPDSLGSQAGFSGGREGWQRFRWPIWEGAMGLDAVRSLLALPLGEGEEWEVPRLREMGIRAVLQSQVVMPSKRYRCFTPARRAGTGKEAMRASGGAGR